MRCYLLTIVVGWCLAVLGSPSLASDVAKLAPGQRIEDGLLDLGSHSVRLPLGPQWTFVSLEDGFQVNIGGVIMKRLRNNVFVVGVSENKLVAMMQLMTFPRDIPMSQWPDEPCRPAPQVFEYQDPISSRMYMPECLARTFKYKTASLARSTRFAPTLALLQARGVELPEDVLRGLYTKYRVTNFIWLNVIIPVDSEAGRATEGIRQFDEWMKEAARVIPEAMAGTGLIQLPVLPRVTYAASDVAASKARSASAKELFDERAVRLTPQELSALLHPGSSVTHVAPSTGNSRSWTNREDGTFVVSTRSVDAAYGTSSEGEGIWRVTDDGRYCATINWKKDREDWCRAVYRYQGTMYLAPVDLEKAGNTRYGLIEVK